MVAAARGWRVGLAGAAVAVSVACAAFGYRYGEAERAERIVDLKPALDDWRASFERDTRDLNQAQRDVDRWLGSASGELSRIQMRVLQLEALARRLIERTALETEEFDFDSEPGVGGPEELGLERNSPMAFHAAATTLVSQVEDHGRQLEILEEVLKWRDLNAAVRPEGRPVTAAYVSSAFGPRIDPFSGRRASHKGIDFAGRPGTEIVAVGAGIVTWSGPRSGYGEMVQIDHGSGLVTRYAHNSKNLVEVGDVVTRGQSIAWLGSTGRATGPNLHFEVLRDGEAVNPLQYIE